MKLFPLYTFYAFLLLSCIKKDVKEVTYNNPSGYIKYASTLNIQKYKGYSLVEISKLWQNAGNEKMSLLFAGADVQIPDSLSDLTLIRTPVNSVVCFSTTHIGYIAALGKTDIIKGVSGKDLFCDPVLKRNLNLGKVADVGYPPSVDYETILKIMPDVVFLYGLESSVTGVMKRLADAGIVSVVVADFLEMHPLGKAEWIKFFAGLFDAGEKGDSIFELVSENYLSFKNTVENVCYKPKILTGLPWKDTWYMAGGKSFTARFIEDAGGDYLYKNNPSDEYIPLSLETVYNTSASADIWINCGTALSMDDLYARDQRFSVIKAFRTEQVYNNNARLNQAGGNDFWESGVVRADLILRDMITIFHPGRLENENLVYYRKLE